ncbi:uncharacterized protein IWZ02DRAFT_248149 [Phyllosticta citriasiana]|uniref:uncharacterized protein n=1 Tax=Phyllosticta citriasiana TaxID=595635 RepID=UPI0030FDB958
MEWTWTRDDKTRNGFPFLALLSSRLFLINLIDPSLVNSTYLELVGTADDARLKTLTLHKSLLPFLFPFLGFFFILRFFNMSAWRWTGMEWNELNTGSRVFMCGSAGLVWYAWRFVRLSFSLLSFFFLLPSFLTFAFCLFFVATRSGIGRMMARWRD